MGFKEEREKIAQLGLYSRQCTFCIKEIVRWRCEVYGDVPLAYWLAHEKCANFSGITEGRRGRDKMEAGESLP